MLKEMPEVGGTAWERALPYLKPSVGEDGRPSHLIDDESAPILLDLGNGLLVAFLVDAGDHFVYLQGQDLADADVEPADLYHRSLKNLSQKVSEEGLKLFQSGSVFGARLDGHFEASLLLLDWLWDEELISQVSNGYLACVPARDVLAFCDLASKEGAAELSAITENIEGFDHPVSSSLFIRQSGVWIPWTGSVQ